MTLHPDPQMAGQWLDLTGPWGFAYDDADRGLSDGWHQDVAAFGRTIHVPFPPESRASGIGDPAEHRLVWYRREFALSELPGSYAATRIVLHFGAVDYEGYGSVHSTAEFMAKYEELVAAWTAHPWPGSATPS